MRRQVGSTLQVGALSLTLQACLQERSEASTWSAFDPPNGRALVVKDALLGGPHESALREEARILARLSSDRFPSLVLLEARGDRLFLVTTRLPGETLQDRLRSGALPLREVLLGGHALWTALCDLHAQDVLHGDLKPAHLVLHGGTIGICDFGFSRRCQDTVSPRGLTPRYAAPEQLGLISHPVGVQADLYSGALIMVEALLDRSVWSERTTFTERLAPADVAWPKDVPVMLSRLFAKALHPQPSRRYATAHGLLADWDRLTRDISCAFGLGTSDRRVSLDTPSMVGRQQELAELSAYLQTPESRPFWVGALSEL